MLLNFPNDILREILSRADRLERTCLTLKNLFGNSTTLCRALLPYASPDAKVYMLAKPRLCRPIINSIIWDAEVAFDQLDSVFWTDNAEIGHLLLTRNVVYGFKTLLPYVTERIYNDMLADDLGLWTDPMCKNTIIEYSTRILAETADDNSDGEIAFITNKILAKVSILDKGSQVKDIWLSEDSSFDVKHVCCINDTIIVVCGDGIYELKGRKLVVKDTISAACNSETEIFYFTKEGVKCICPPLKDVMLVANVLPSGSMFRQILYREVHPTIADVTEYRKFLIVLCDDFIAIYYRDMSMGGYEYRRFKGRNAHPGWVYTAMSERFKSLVVCALSPDETLVLNFYNWFKPVSVSVGHSLVDNPAIVRVHIDNDSILFFSEYGELFVYPQ